MANIIQAVKDELTLENVLLTAMHTPGVKINREKFLRKELLKYCPEDVVTDAVQNNPAKAGIPKRLINTVSKQVIDYESTKVTGISVAASIPGGPAAIGAAAADITSYFAFILRVTQELAYLYGFDEFDLKEDNIDSETMNVLLLFIGVMFGVQGASSALRKVADTFSRQVAKKLAQKALTKGMIYPVVKRIAQHVGIRMTKQIFADSVASAIPVLGSIASGGLTLVMFRPCCMRLRDNLMSYTLCDPDFYQSAEADSIDADFDCL